MGSSRPFRFGVINERMQTASAWNADARRTEQLGYSTFLIRDHFVPDHFGDQRDEDHARWLPRYRQ